MTEPPTAGSTPPMTPNPPEPSFGTQLPPGLLPDLPPEQTVDYQPGQDGYSSTSTAILDIDGESGPGTLGPPHELVGLSARNISAWFGSHKVLERVSLDMEPGSVTALIGPSGCGKSTFLRILNRMHEMVPSAALAGSVILDGVDVYGPTLRVTETRLRIGMVFQKPNPFPSMTIAQNVTAGLKLAGIKLGRSEREELIERSLTRAGLWTEVRD